MTRTTEHPARAARHEEMRRLIRRCVEVADGVTWESLAGRLGMTRQALANKLAEGSNSTLGPHDLIELMHVVPGLAEALGFREAKAAKVNERHPLTAVANAIRECAEVSAKAAEALHDGVVMPSEAAAISKEAADARRALNEFEASVAVAASKVIEMAGSRR